MANHKKSKKYWFKLVRGSYLPADWHGLAIYLVYVAYLVFLLAAWLIGGHTLWGFLTVVIPLMVAAGVLTQLIAARHAD